MDSLESNDSRFVWGDLKRRDKFQVLKPQPPKLIAPPPQIRESDYTPTYTFMDILLKSKKLKKEVMANAEYTNALVEHKRMTEYALQKNEEFMSSYEINVVNGLQKKRNSKRKLKRITSILSKWRLCTLQVMQKALFSTTKH